jgi:hypothetical protein
MQYEKPVYKYFENRTFSQKRSHPVFLNTERDLNIILQHETREGVKNAQTKVLSRSSKNTEARALACKKEGSFPLSSNENGFDRSRGNGEKMP